MPDSAHVDRLLEGIAEWNAWREANPSVRPNLSAAYLGRANLRGANLKGADLREANLLEADLHMANLSQADLSDSILRGADLTASECSNARFCRAYLSEANMFHATLRNASLTKANLAGAKAVPWRSKSSSARLKNRLEVRGFRKPKRRYSTSVIFVAANLSRADLTAAKLCEAN